MKNFFVCNILSLLFLAGCSGEKPFDGASSATNYSGTLLVSSVTTDPATGPGLVSSWKTDGTFKATLRDLFPGGEFASGSGFISPDKFVIAIEGVDRLEILNLSSGQTSAITNVALNATTMKHVAVDPGDGSIYVAEQNINTVEKFTTSGQRIGSPFLPTTLAPCSLNNPWGLAVIPATGDVVVISAAGAAGRFSRFSKDGACLNHSIAAPFNSGTPTAIAYHSPTNKLLVTLSTLNSIVAVDVDGSNPQTIFLNSAIMSTPRAIATDADGFIYVGSSGTDTIEKLYWSGTGSATRATSGPLIGPSAFSQNPTAITVAP
ncbi:MAG: hypothetical protein ACK5P7_13260 [Bdellovibrio sp.]